MTENQFYECLYQQEQRSKDMSDSDKLKILVEKIRNLYGYVVVYSRPDDWDYGGMGRGPDLNECDYIDLDEWCSETLEEVGESL